ncbi:MAG: glycosyltransferase family 39 protein, partial [Victivallales bacterium]|nr:glycosyltransferase family 39 protein [Victivallales bacterium]
MMEPISKFRVTRVGSAGAADRQVCPLPHLRGLASKMSGRAATGSFEIGSIELVKAIFSKDAGDAEVLKILGSGRFFLQCMALLGVLYFAFLWTYPLIDRDEGFHVGTAAEMLRKGDWIVPTINDETFFHKPVMIYWLTMPSLMIFGHNEFAARLPSALCMFLLVVIFQRLLKKITGDEVFSNTSTLVMAFTPIYVIVARTALTDGPLLLFVTVGLLSFFIAMEERRGPDVKWYLLFWLCLALGFLTKGPVAPAVMGPTVAVYCIFQKKMLHVLRRGMIPLGILIFFAVNFWYLIMIHRLGQEYIEGFFVNQIFKRGTKVLVSRGGGP